MKFSFISAMNYQDTQEFSPDQGIRHMFKKVINGKYGNCDLDNLQERTIWKTLSDSEHHKSYYQKSDLIQWQRIYTGEKPYKYIAHDKSLNANHTLFASRVFIRERNPTNVKNVAKIYLEVPP